METILITFTVALTKAIVSGEVQTLQSAYRFRDEYASDIDVVSRATVNKIYTIATK